MRRFSLITIIVTTIGCAGPNPNPGERTTDIAWTTENFDRAYEIAKPHAESGDPWAQLRIAIFYENGWGVKRDPKKAYEWYLKAVSQKSEGDWANGHLIGAMGKAGYFNQNSDALIAEYNLANLIYRGDGIDKNLVKSYVHVSNVINESNGSSVFFCCEFAGGRSFSHNQFVEFKQKLESIMTQDQLSEAIKILNK